MKVVELREKNIDELLGVVDDLKTGIHQRKMDVAMNVSQEYGDISKMKKDLARVKTVINEKKQSA